MGTLVQVLGVEGTGKTYSAGSLDPKSTYYVNCDRKNLPFKGWKSKYNTEAKNYAKESDAKVINALLKGISEKRPDIKCVIIDTINSVMSDKEIAERKKVGHDKWMDLASDVYELYNTINNDLRDDLTVFVIGHVESYDVNYQQCFRLKTNGQKLTKLNVEGKCTYTLYTYVNRTSDTAVEYGFTTQSDGKNTARSPEGCFDYKIPNDLNFVLRKITEFEN